MKDLNIALFQMCSVDSFKQNAHKILSFVNDIDLSRVDLCLFPENALYIDIDKTQETEVINFEDEFFKTLQALSKETNTFFHLGSLPRAINEKIYNSTLWISPDEGLSFPYDKIHLFAAKIKDLNINEGAVYSPGSEPALMSVKGWSVGLSICFDLRFSELYSHYVKQGADLLLAPSAFFRKTGRLHWEVLLRARAVESQCYMAASAQVGVHKSVLSERTRQSYGHSLVVDPWGEVLQDLGPDQEGVVVLNLEKSEIENMRSSIIMKRVL